jgi:WD40 repeat protein
MKRSHLAPGFVILCIALLAIAQPNPQTRHRSPRITSGLTDIVWSVKFSPDGHTLAIARGTNDAGRVELWDVETGTLKHSIKGFDGTVWSISFTPDGRTLVSGSGGFHTNKIQEKLARRDRTPFVELKWWNTETGELKQRVELPDDDAISLMAAHSPDGSSLATIEYRAVIGFSTISFGFDPGRGSNPGMLPITRSVTYDADLKLLDARTGEVRLKLKGNIGSYEMPIFWGSNSSSDLRSMIMVNLRRGAPAFSPDGELVAAWSPREIKLWKATTGEEVRKLKDFKGRLSAATFSPDGRTLAAAITKFSFKNKRPDFKSEVRTWDVNTGAVKQVLPLTTQSISSLVFALNGRQLLISGTMSDEIRSFATLEVADLQSGSLGRVATRDEGNTSSLVLSPDGRMVAFQTDASSVRLVDTEIWKTKYTFDETSDGSVINTAGRRFLLSVKSIMALAFSADGKTVSGEIEQGGIKLWDAQTGEVKKHLGDHDDTGSMAVLSSDGTTLAEVGGEDEKLRLWNIPTGEKKTTPDNNGSASAIALSPDGRKLATAYPNSIILLNTVTGQVIQKLDAPGSRIDCLTFAADGQTLATATDDGKIQTWDLVGGRVIRTIAGGGKITTLRFAPGGRTLAAAAENGIVDLWDLQTGGLSLQLKKHSGAVNAIAFSVDGNWMATGGDDRSVIVWETATGKARRTLKGHDLTVTSLAFSPDGTLLASGAGNASVVLWDLPSGKLNRVLK